MKTLSTRVLVLLLFTGVPSLWSYTNLTPAEVYARLVAGDTVLVLDVREVDEYEAGHMAEPPGNLPMTPVNMPLNSNVLGNQFSLLPRDIDIIVYCRSGGRSANASSFLETQGFTRIFNMTGGFSSWTYEFRTGWYGDHSGLWIRANDTFPVILSFVNNSDTSKIIFPTAPFSEGIDSVYMELHLASTTAQIPPQKPISDIENIYRLTVLDRYAVSLFDADSLILSDSASIYLSLSTEVISVLNAQMYVFVPGTGWPPVSAHFEPMLYHRTNTILRKWYYLGADYDPSRVEYHTTNELPGKFELYQNYPNPFNPVTTISFMLPKPDHITLEVFNSLGQKVQTLLKTEMTAGSFNVEFQASYLPSGIYYYRIKSSEYQCVKKMILIK